MTKLKIRPATAEDLPFVIETAAKVRWPKGTTFHAWSAAYRTSYHKLVADGGRVLVAEADGVILGFAIVDAHDRLEMVYVKRDFRGAGIGLQLLGEAGLRPPFHLIRPTPSVRRWLKFHALAVA